MAEKKKVKKVVKQKTKPKKVVKIRTPLPETGSFFKYLFWYISNYKKSFITIIISILLTIFLIVFILAADICLFDKHGDFKPSFDKPRIEFKIDKKIKK